MKKNHLNSEIFQEKLLGWYGRYRRDLPWRAKKGKKPDPYHVWLSEIMLQQTTVPAVKSYFEKFVELWPSVSDLAKADPECVMREWAGLGYYARARNLLKCAAVVAFERKGIFPADEKDLQSLAGIGPYTAAAISAIAFNREAVVIDGNVERVVSRLFAIDVPLPQGKKDIREKAVEIYKGVGKRAADLPQALMDLGAMVCTPKSPKCALCPVSCFCQAFEKECAEDYPKRGRKIPRPERRGTVYWIETPDGGVVVERRDEKRMLGGMTGLPTSDWDLKSLSETGVPLSKSQIARGEKIGQIRHVFTHFSLILEVVRVKTPRSRVSLKENQHIISGNDIKNVGFPSLFRKAAAFCKTDK